MNSRRRRNGEPGKLGIVRLYGAKLRQLREDCWNRAQGICERCFSALYYEPRFDGDPIAYDMAHKKSRGAGGSDVLENVECLCHSCHMKAHAGR